MDKRTFIKWIKKQPFYENTLIVVVGDHPTMGFDEIAAGKKRRVFDLYINSVISDRQFIKQRDFTALDTLPTLLEAIGYVVPNHKFGLGVSLFSGEKTLLEEIGDVEVFSNELNMQSAVYNKIF